jgi:hypothetical protein
MAHWTPIPQPRCKVLTTISRPITFCIPGTRCLSMSHHVSVTPIIPSTMHLELGELLGRLALAGQNTEDVETDGLGKRPALANDDLVTGLDTESGRDVCGEVLVALLVTGVLGDEVEVFTADDQGACLLSAVCSAKTCFHLPKFEIISSCGKFRRKRAQRTVHLGGHDGSGEDTATDGDHAGEWALLVDVAALNGSLGRAEAQTDILIPSPAAGVLARSADLVVQEDVRLSRRISIRRARFYRGFLGCSTCFW